MVMRRMFSTGKSSTLKLMFLGAPGAGKGTYASRIAPMLKIPTISTGDLVRHEIKTGTELGAKIKAYNDRGALVPDDIVMDMVEKRLAKPDAQRGFILDGFPRNVPQAEAFQKVTKLDLVVNIDLPQWILADKISGRRVCTSCGTGYNVAFINSGEYHMPPLLPKVDSICDNCGTATLVQRPDDNEEVVRRRLEVYNDETAPLVDYYDKLELITKERDTANPPSVNAYRILTGIIVAVYSTRQHLERGEVVMLLRRQRALAGAMAVTRGRQSPIQARWMAAVTQQTPKTVEIGGVVAKVNQDTKAVELVPRGYLPLGRELSQELLGHLRWMLQKDLLKQDMFLIGPPGASRRLLSMRFAELLHKEVEYIAISQDTTEADLKQRREITDGAAIFTDQAPVRAAINGRVLVIDGLEKAERNVLPTLNNLLENREMTLDDGRFLMKAESYDALLEAGYSRADLNAQNLIRVHPDFRVIALGLPVPPYPGRTLDPPLRSRFQARNVQPSSPGTQLESLVAAAPSVPMPTLERLVGIREAVNTIEAMHDGISRQRMPHFDYLSLTHCAHVMANFPQASVSSVIRRVFPVTKDILGVKSAANCETLDRILKNFSSGIPEVKYTLDQLEKRSVSDVSAVGTFRRVEGDEVKTVELEIPCGTISPQVKPMRNFVETETHSSVLVNMIQDHAAGSDLCVLGTKGSGKSDLARLFAHRLGYATELFSLFKDMTARDLLQRRSTDANGNTRWEDSPLIHAARRGHIAILDGVHRLGSDSLGVLQRLVQDREIDLADGTKLLSQAKYDAILQEVEAKDKPLKALDHVFPIHPSFRIIAIAESEPSSTKSMKSAPGRESTTAWLNSDSIAMFSFHHLPELSRVQNEEIVHKLFPNLQESTTGMLLSFSEKLRDAKLKSSNNEYDSLLLSLRQLLRSCRRLNAFPDQSTQDLRPLLHDTLMTQFLPAACGRLVDSLLDQCYAPAAASTSNEVQQSPDTIRQEDGKLYIGDVCQPISEAKNPELVPQPHYFDIPKHTKTMKDMLQDVVAGQKHLLLIGNQGVGKNKLADRLLQLMQQEREYIQLHRDTTVQTLTLVPTLNDGKIVWEDSPLVRAARTGRTLLVDEADKAPLEVVCVLKGLIEDGEMLLGNGKRLVDPNKVTIEQWHDEDDIIRLHPEFRMWVLANRPGFPFLGNNFFREIGDVFASHAIDNPDEESELALLQAYAPSVSVDVLRRLCKAFAELRELVENGTLTYPYSTREAVAVAKHLEKFPNDGIKSVLENVLAFDAYDKNLRKQLTEVFISHGISLSATGQEMNMGVMLAESQKLPPVTTTEKWQWAHANVERFSFSEKKKLPQHQFYSSLNRRQIWLDPSTTRAFPVQQQRVQFFTEEFASFRVPLKANRKQKTRAMAVFPDNSMHVLTTQPMSLHSFSDVLSSERTHKVQEIENQYMQWEKNPVLVNLPQKAEVGVFIPSTGLCIFLSPSDAADGRASCITLPENILEGQVHEEGGKRRTKKQQPFSTWFSGSPSNSWTVPANSSNDGSLVRYQQGGSIFQLIDLNATEVFSLDLSSTNTTSPIHELANVKAIGQNEWILQTTDETMVHLLKREKNNDFVLSEASVSKSAKPADTRQSIIPMDRSQLGNQDAGKLTVHAEAFLQSIEDTNGSWHVESAIRETDKARWGMNGAWTMRNGEFIVNTKADNERVDLEVTYPELQTTKTIILAPKHSHGGSSTSKQHDPSFSYPQVVDAAEVHGGKYVVTLQEEGDVKLWQLDQQAIDHEMNLWKQMFGLDGQDSGKLELKVDGRAVGGESVPKTGLDKPKYGKDDPNNDPHVGGNTWAGGTGGSDTAGLGGRGGPYRLDKGHPVHQVSQAKKDEVSAEARAKAHAMAEEALASKLEEINMSEREWETYQTYFSRVEQESAQLRSILDNLESFSQERSWLKHQSSGELDDAKLVDGVTGERLVFKRRGISDSPFQTMHQTKPKRMLFVMDVSGSIYRFNGQDGRLERILETSLMIMESFAGFESKFDYCIMGHSGDSPDIPFVNFGEPPADRKERLKVLQRMVAHTQYCMSGDHTVEAIDHAVQRVVEEDGDDYFVFVVSDANLERYNIQPKYMGRQLLADPRVKAHAIFIASFANEAERIMKELPPGRGHVCLDTTDLPRTFKKILSSAFSTT